MSSTRFRNSGLNCGAQRGLDLLAHALLVGLAPTMNCEPTFEVMIRTVFLKSTVRPWPSVSRPSSSTCSSTLKTSGCAFSISSNRTTRVRAGAAPPR